MLVPSEMYFIIKYYNIQYLLLTEEGLFAKNNLFTSYFKTSYLLTTRAKALETKPSSTLLRTRYWGFLKKAHSILHSQVLCGLKAYIFLDSSVQRTRLD